MADRIRLGESARRLAMALGAARMVAWEFDVATGNLEYSPDIDGKPPWLRFDDRALAAKLREHALHGSGPYAAEFRLEQPERGVTWVRYQGEISHDEQGRPARIIGIALDITERKEADELLRNIAEGVSVATGEAFFRSLVQHLCSVLRTDFACVSELDEHNPGSLRAFAFFVGDRFSDEVEYELSGTPCEQVLASGRGSYPRNVRSFFPRDHHLVEMGVEGYLGVALIGSTGKPLGVMSVMSRSPISNFSSAEIILSIFASRVSSELERRRAERALRESESRTRESQRFAERFAQTTPNVLFVWDLIEQRSVYSSDRSVDVIGYTPKEIAEMGSDFVHQCLHPDDIALMPQRAEEYAARQDGEVFEHVFRMRHKSGQWRWVHRSAMVFSRTPDGRPKEILGAVTDITRFKQAELELRELSARLLNVQDEERRRIARELHDVTGQNLTAIDLNLTVLEQSGAVGGAMKNILLECQRLCGESKEEIRTLSYLLHPPMLDQFGLVGALEWYVSGFGKRTRIHTVLDVAPDLGRLPTDLEIDLFRVIQEGLTNIMRYSGSETAAIRLVKREGGLLLEIEDQGRGFASKPALEEQSGESGFGVGIPGMRERLRQHGGTLEVRSGPEGTTLIAVVPLTAGGPGNVLN